jgi:hypothetical protein
MARGKCALHRATACSGPSGISSPPVCGHFADDSSQGWLVENGLGLGLRTAGILGTGECTGPAPSNLQPHPQRRGLELLPRSARDDTTASPRTSESAKGMLRQTSVVISRMIALRAGSSRTDSDSGHNAVVWNYYRAVRVMIQQLLLGLNSTLVSIKAAMRRGCCDRRLWSFRE